MWTKKSTSGTRPTASSEEKALTTQDICAIMEACSKTSVSKLKFGGLSLEFDRPTNPNRTVEENFPVPLVVAEKNERDAILRDEVALREEQIKEMRITDPLRAEELLLAGELEDDDAVDGE